MVRHGPRSCKIAATEDDTKVPESHRPASPPPLLRLIPGQLQPPLRLPRLLTPAGKAVVKAQDMVEMGDPRVREASAVGLQALRVGWREPRSGREKARREERWRPGRRQRAAANSPWRRTQLRRLGAARGSDQRHSCEQHGQAEQRASDADAPVVGNGHSTADHLAFLLSRSLPDPTFRRQCMIHDEKLYRIVFDLGSATASTRSQREGRTSYTTIA